ncbi:rRNA processing protein Rrp8 [Venturia nashicola]|uniref:Ribosomal RNA-processing protein 8 n=1 Tax=Venturia nashicola TaxID=86259 RepID=A0A4Z1NZU8_9PEZI|nr:rRNA processing protein Rrp8 [Venturia nashicola]TLD32169.1 rRNA processing protein Rrp8 [Venturia nashicola]
MFAVSGWSISAPLKTQLDVPKSATGPGEDGKPPSNKRKRAAEKREKAGIPAVTKDNVDDMWQKVIEGKTRPPQNPATRLRNEKKAAKKRKEREAAGQSAEKTTSTSNGRDKAPLPATPEGGEDEAAQPKEKKTKKDGSKDKSQTDIALSKDDSVRDSTAAFPTPQNPATKARNEKKKQKKASESTAPPPAPVLVASKLTPLQQGMAAKLASARFRHLNEKLYTSPSEEALELFTRDADTFESYHSGFRQQVEVWPENPVDGYITDIQARANIRFNRKGEVKGHKIEGRPPGEKEIPRTQGACTIADLGCGDARLASELFPKQQKLNVKILSFDLHSPSKFVKKADIANLPLPNGGINVAIFCLALMGTNWVDFIDEAWRILHWKGELWIAEIKSRFGRVSNSKGKVVDHSVGKRQKPRSKMSDKEKKTLDSSLQAEEDTLAVAVDGVESQNKETDVSAFIKVLKSRGFLLDGEDSEAVDLSNRMFVKMRFLKAVAPVKGKNAEGAAIEKATWKPKKAKFLDAEDEVDESRVLKPCVYKLR